MGPQGFRTTPKGVLLPHGTLTKGCTDGPSARDAKQKSQGVTFTPQTSFQPWPRCRDAKQFYLYGVNKGLRSVGRTEVICGRMPHCTVEQEVKTVK